MLPDQADKLRRLVSRSLSVDRPPRGRLTVLSGCKGGVGVTTLSLNLAVALRSLVGRVLLIDCCPLRGDLASIYRIKGEYDIDDLVAGRCGVRDAITLGPAGIQVIPRFGIRESMSPTSCWQLLRHLDEVSHEFDQIVIDAGSCPAVAEVLWPAANSAVVVTTTDQVSFTDAYALVKSMINKNVNAGRIAFGVNCYRDQRRAMDVQRRLRRSCQQFLDLEVGPLGCIPQDEHWETAVMEARSIACARPVSPASTAIYDIARQLATGPVDSNDLNHVVAS